MTAGQVLDQNSSVNNVSAWTHLNSPSGNGTILMYKGLNVIVSSKQKVIKYVSTEYNIKLKDKSKTVIIEDKAETVKRMNQNIDIRRCNEY